MKVTNTGRPPRMFSIAYTTYQKRCRIFAEITSKKVRGNNVGFSTIEITLKKVRENNMNFSTSEIMSKKVRVRNYIEKVRGNDVEIR